MKSPRELGADRGSRMMGWLVPPVTGEYVFWIPIALTILSKSIDFFPFPKKPREISHKGGEISPLFFLYLIYVESHRDASGCILPLTIIIIIIPPLSRRRRRQQPSLPPRRRPSRTSSLAVGPRRAAPLTFLSSARQGPSEIK